MYMLVYSYEYLNVVMISQYILRHWKIFYNVSAVREFKMCVCHTM